MAYLCSPEALIEIFSEAKRLYPLGSESAVHYEVYMRAHILKHGDLDIVSVARALHVDRIKAEQMLNFAVSKEWQNFQHHANHAKTLDRTSPPLKLDGWLALHNLQPTNYLW